MINEVSPASQDRGASTDCRTIRRLGRIELPPSRGMCVAAVHGSHIQMGTRLAVGAKVRGTGARPVRMVGGKVQYVSHLCGEAKGSTVTTKRADPDHAPVDHRTAGGLLQYGQYVMKRITRAGAKGAPTSHAASVHETHRMVGGRGDASYLRVAIPHMTKESVVPALNSPIVGLHDHFAGDRVQGRPI